MNHPQVPSPQYVNQITNTSNLTPFKTGFPDWPQLSCTKNLYEKERFGNSSLQQTVLQGGAKK